MANLMFQEVIFVECSIAMFGIKNRSKPVRITLTDKQYRELVEIIFTGTWLLNRCKKQKKVIKGYIETVQHFYSYYNEVPAACLIDYDKRFQEFFPTTAVEQKMLPIIQECNELNFTEELIARIAMEALERHDNLSVRDRIRIEEACKNEIQTHGVGGLYVRWEKEPV